MSIGDYAYVDETAWAHIPDELCGFAGCCFVADHGGRHSWHTA